MTEKERYEQGVLSRELPLPALQELGAQALNEVQLEEPNKGL